MGMVIDAIKSYCIDHLLSIYILMSLVTYAVLRNIQDDGEPTMDWEDAFLGVVWPAAVMMGIVSLATKLFIFFGNMLGDIFAWIIKKCRCRANVDNISCYYGACAYLDDVQEWIDEQPTVDQVKHGRWINVERWKYTKCSVCDSGGELQDNTFVLFAYCPHCGSKMDLKEDKNAYDTSGRV